YSIFFFLNALPTTELYTLSLHDALPISAVSGPKYMQSLQDHPEPIGEPPWGESPYHSSAWRFGIDLIPTISHVSEQGFGAWSDEDRKSTRLNSSHLGISYAVFCLKKKNK